MRYPTDALQRTAPAAKLYPGFSRRRLRLEPEAPEETKIRDLENQIGEARRNGTPVGLLIRERKRTYDSWLERLDRQLNETTAGKDRESIKQERERAIREYKWPDS